MDSSGTGIRDALDTVADIVERMDTSIGLQAGVVMKIRQEFDEGYTRLSNAHRLLEQRIEGVGHEQQVLDRRQYDSVPRGELNTRLNAIDARIVDANNRLKSHDAYDARIVALLQEAERAAMARQEIRDRLDALEAAQRGGFTAEEAADNARMPATTRKLLLELRDSLVRAANGNNRQAPPLIRRIDHELGLQPGDAEWDDAWLSDANADGLPF
jgi:hypothetical protein